MSRAGPPCVERPARQLAIPRARRRRTRAGLLLLALLLALGPGGCGERAPDPGAGSAVGDAPSRPGTGPTTSLQLDDDELARAGVRVAPARADRLAPELPAYGRVLDPAPASEALANLTAARAAAETARRELARVESLARDRENASEREVEMARATAARAAADLELAEYRVDAVLGPSRGALGDLADLARRLSRRQVALVRVDVPGGSERPEPERGAHLVAYPQLDEALAARLLGAAPDADPQRPGWSFLFLVDGRSTPSGPVGAPPPGSPVRAHLAARGDVLTGVRVPASALLRSEGRLFVLLALGHGRFERREVAARVLPDGSALVTQGVEPGASLVVAGAQQLLSAQRLATGADGAGD